MGIRCLNILFLINIVVYYLFKICYSIEYENFGDFYVLFYVD